MVFQNDSNLKRKCEWVEVIEINSYGYSSRYPRTLTLLKIHGRVIQFQVNSDGLKRFESFLHEASSDVIEDLCDQLMYLVHNRLLML